MRSVTATATVAANSSVAVPITALMSAASGASSNSGYMRAIRYTPAVTIVAAWIREETGVGPSMASGSQVCSGSWPDLAKAPTRSIRQAATSWPSLVVNTLSAAEKTPS